MTSSAPRSGGLVVATGFTTFKVKYAVQDIEDELNRVRRHTIAEQQEIRVLTAEWTYLTQPERLGRTEPAFSAAGADRPRSSCSAASRTSRWPPPAARRAARHRRRGTHRRRSRRLADPPTAGRDIARRRPESRPARRPAASCQRRDRTARLRWRAAAAAPGATLPGSRALRCSWPRPPVRTASLDALIAQIAERQ